VRSIDDLDVAGKRVLIRTDLNVPLEQGRISDDGRIRASVPTIAELSRRGARVVVAAHLGRPGGQVRPEQLAVRRMQPFARTLEQELNALLRGASLECLVCGEFVMHAREGVVFCPECGCVAGTASAMSLIEDGDPALEFGLQAG